MLFPPHPSSRITFAWNIFLLRNSWTAYVVNLCNVSRPSSSGNVARRIRKTAGGSDLQTAIFAVLSSFPTSVRCRSAVHIPVRLIDSDEEAGNGCKLKAISWDFPTVPRVEANCDCRRASPLINLFFRLSLFALSDFYCFTIFFSFC